MSPRRALVLLSLLLPACSEPEQITPAGKAYAGTLAMDIRGNVAVSILVATDSSVGVTLQPDMSDTGGLLDPNTKLSAPGKVERFPETGSELYTAKFSIPARPGSPCGVDPISLGLSLHRRGDNVHVGGSLTAYCGKDRFYGVPARVLRLSGDLPTSAPGGSK